MDSAWQAVSQVSPRSTAAVNLAMLTVLNVQAVSTLAHHVSVASQSMPLLRDVFPLPSATTVKPLAREVSVRESVTADSSSMKVCAYLEDASMDTLTMDMVDA